MVKITKIIEDKSFKNQAIKKYPGVSMTIFLDVLEA